MNIDNDSNESNEELSVGELLRKYRNQERIFNFEGDAGMARLNKITEVLGYRENQFRYGSSLEVFLQDNPGAIEALLDWVEEQDLSEWRESLESELNEDEDEDEDEDENE